MFQSFKSLCSHFFGSTEFSTFSGVVDIIVIRQPNGILLSSAFHVRFGTLRVIDPSSQTISIYVNNKQIEGLKLKLFPEGAGYFEEGEEGSAGTLRPSSKTLELLKLRDGYNRIQFIAETQLYGKQTIEGKIYLFDHTNKLVLSDVDGTITKSDVRGHISTIFGLEWTHSGIAELYTKISKHGYKIIYLSSRPLTFYNYTSEYLKGVKQDGFTLPDGPILLSPDQIISSLNREVVYKKADEFKGALIKNLRSLFPEETDDPIFAGFGNRDTDAIACRYAGVLINKIYIINEKSDIEIVGTQQKTTYKEITANINELFPFIQKKKKKLVQQHQPSSFRKE